MPIVSACEVRVKNLVVITCNLCLPINAQRSGVGVGADGALEDSCLRKEERVTIFFSFLLWIHGAHDAAALMMSAVLSFREKSAQDFRFHNFHRDSKYFMVGYQ